LSSFVQSSTFFDWLLLSRLTSVITATLANDGFIAIAFCELRFHRDRSLRIAVFIAIALGESRIHRGRSQRIAV
jgi:hypothetical protein